MSVQLEEASWNKTDKKKSATKAFQNLPRKVIQEKCSAFTKKECEKLQRFEFSCFFFFWFVLCTVRETPKWKISALVLSSKWVQLKWKFSPKTSVAENKTSTNLNRYLVQTKRRFSPTYWKSKTRKILHLDAFLLSFLFSFCIFCHFSMSEMLSFSLDVFEWKTTKNTVRICFKIRWFLW